MTVTTASFCTDVKLQPLVELCGCAIHFRRPCSTRQAQEVAWMTTWTLKRTCRGMLISSGPHSFWQVHLISISLAGYCVSSALAARRLPSDAAPTEEKLLTRRPIEIATSGHMPLESIQLLRLACSLLPSTTAGTSKVRKASKKQRTVVTMTDRCLKYLQDAPRKR